MADPAAVVRGFFEAMERRDWDAAAASVADDAVVTFTETGERFTGAQFVAMNRAYPEGGTITVVETLSNHDRVAAQVKVDLPPDSFWCAGFYTVSNGQITEGVEHWVTEGSAAPPEWRGSFSIPD